MELNKPESKTNIYKSPIKEGKKSIKKSINNSEKDIRFIQTNFYLNDYNYYNKNILKMNKLREEKIKEHKKTIDNDKKANIMPKMLYFNKFFHSKPKIYQKNNLRIIPNPKSTENSTIQKNISKINKNEEYEKIELAIKSKSIEQNSKRHIKKTIKAFDDLLQYVDGFKIKNREKRLRLLLSENNKDNNIDKNKGETDNDEEDLYVENYNFDEYRQKCKDEKKKHIGNISKTEIDLDSPDMINDLDMQMKTNLLLNDNNNDNIYITQNFRVDENSKNKSSNNSQIKKSYIERNKANEIQDKKYLTINDMILISDDSLANKIKKIRKNFKKDLYFNTNNFGKFKFTELGLHYPSSFDKYKKFPDYKGNDLEEKRMFNYKSKVTNPRYNYTNIGSFNDKFNKDLSEISNYYGKEQAKGRFVRNPLISMFSKYIPNYEQYKDLKFIENRYTSGNRYMFRLKSLINNKKNNFDRLADNIYKKEHKAGYFE